MCKDANPDTYDEYELQQEEKKLMNSAKSFAEKKDSLVMALKNNKWRPPQKRQQIFESLQNRDAEEKELDMAVIANQIQRFGKEADASLR